MQGAKEAVDNLEEALKDEGVANTVRSQTSAPLCTEAGEAHRGSDLGHTSACLQQAHTQWRNQVQGSPRLRPDPVNREGAVPVSISVAH